MNKINFPMLLLAVTVILMFCFAGIAIAYTNYLLMILFIVLGFITMGIGLVRKRKSDY